MLFATTVEDLEATVIRLRKIPGATRTGATKTRQVFGDEVIKDMAIPELIDQYN